MGPLDEKASVTMFARCRCNRSSPSFGCGKRDADVGIETFVLILGGGLDLDPQ